MDFRFPKKLHCVARPSFRRSTTIAAARAMHGCGLSALPNGPRLSRGTVGVAALRRGRAAQSAAKALSGGVSPGTVRIAERARLRNHAARRRTNRRLTQVQGVARPPSRADRETACEGGGVQTLKPAEANLPGDFDLAGARCIRSRSGRCCRRCAAIKPSCSEYFHLGGRTSMERREGHGRAFVESAGVIPGAQSGFDPP